MPQGHELVVVMPTLEVLPPSSLWAIPPEALALKRAIHLLVPRMVLVPNPITAPLVINLSPNLLLNPPVLTPALNLLASILWYTVLL